MCQYPVIGESCCIDCQRVTAAGAAHGGEASAAGGDRCGVVADVVVGQVDRSAAAGHISIGLEVAHRVGGTAIDVEHGVGRHRIGIHRDRVATAAGGDRGVAAAGGNADAIIGSIAGVHGEVAAEVGGADVADQIVDDLLGCTALIEGARLRQECGIDRQGVIAAGAAD